jgi:hypothetical protein
VLYRQQAEQRLRIAGGTSMLHLWSNDSDDDTNALTGHWRAVLIEVGVSLGALVVFVAYWVAAALLLHRLAP